MLNQSSDIPRSLSRIIRNARCEAEGILILHSSSDFSDWYFSSIWICKNLFVTFEKMQWILVESWYWMLCSHCSYFSALINQFLLDQVLEHFPLQYLCCWMNNQLSEKCIPATALLLSARVHHCVIVWAYINPFAFQTLFSWFSLFLGRGLLL